jgi:hypothetical protein
MRRRLLIALVIALLAVPVVADYPLLLFGKTNPNSPTGNCSNLATLHPEDVLCAPENITGTPN